MEFGVRQIKNKWLINKQFVIVFGGPCDVISLLNKNIVLQCKVLFQWLSNLSCYFSLVFFPPLIIRFRILQRSVVMCEILLKKIKPIQIIAFDSTFGWYAFCMQQVDLVDKFFSWSKPTEESQTTFHWDTRFAWICR